MVPILASALLLLSGPGDDPRQSQPALRFQKSLRLPVKSKPALVTAQSQKTKPRVDGAVVEVYGDARPLESVRDQTLREFRQWLVANRFRGATFVPALQPAFISTAPWEQTHPGGFTVAPLVPLGWGY